jgi:hypothetical protein
MEHRSKTPRPAAVGLVLAGMLLLLFAGVSRGNMTDSLRMRLKLDETSGTTASDASGYNHPGTLVNGPTWVGGRYSNAVQFDTVNDYIKVSDFNYQAGRGVFTLSFWFNVSGNAVTGATRAIFGHGAQGSRKSLCVYMKKDTLRTSLYDSLNAPGATALDVRGITTSNYANSQWHLYTLTANIGSVQVYLDTVQKAATTSYLSGTTTYNPPDTILFGKYLTGSYAYGGKLDDIRMYTRALSVADVKLLYTQGPPTVATGAAATPSTVTGNKTFLTVLGADDAGEANLTYKWATTGTPPAAVTFKMNGTNAAKNDTATFTKAGSYSLIDTIKDQGGNTVTSSVTVIVNQTLTTITVSPNPATVQTNGQQQFAASAVDQFGTTMSVTPTWSVSGGGTINSSGLFTAGATAGGPYTVTAASGGKSGTAQVTVTANIYQLTVNWSAGGSATPGGTTPVKKDSLVRIIGIPNTGWAFLNWTRTDGASQMTIADSSRCTTTVQLHSGNGTVVANFVNITYQLTVQSESNGSASPLGSFPIVRGAVDTLRATPNHGYLFKKWQVTDGMTIINPYDTFSTTTRVSLHAGFNVTIVAQFKPVPYLLTISADANGTVTPSGTDTAYYSVPFNITATPNANYQFDHWEVVSAVGTATFGDPNAAATTVTLMDGNASIKAFFMAEGYKYPKTCGRGDSMVVDGSVQVTAGNLIVTNGKIKIKSWSIQEPDYVFNKDYALPQLQDVEKYVKDNNHLPEVPSAGEMRKNGIDLTEMNLKLLKKVEELTIYTIEQNKRIEALERKIEEGTK